MNRRNFLKSSLQLSSLLLLSGIAKAATLPQNYQTQSGTKLLNTNAGLGGITSQSSDLGDAVWAVSEVTDTNFLRPFFPEAPTKVYKLQVTTPGTVDSRYQLNFATSINPQRFNQLYILGKVVNNGGQANSGTLFLTDGAGFANYYSWDFGYQALDEGNWRYKYFARTSPSTTVGSPATQPVLNYLRYRVGAKAGTSPTYYICPVYVNTFAKPQIVFTFDDGNQQDYDNAYPYMLARGVTGSIQVAGESGSSALGSPGLAPPSVGLSLANLQTMIDNGWSAHNHTATHPDLTTLTEGQIREEFRKCRSWLQANRIPVSPYAMVYPFGARNSTVDAVAAEFVQYGFQSGGDATNGFPYQFGVMEPFKMERVSLDTPITLSTVISNLANSISRGNSVIYKIHRPEVGAVTGTTELSNLQAVVRAAVKYRDANVAQICNLDEFFTRMSYPHFVRR